MKNKLIVMFLTFIVLILLTPYIFGKLMNSKFNSMILKISQQKGIQVKEIKNNSSYLTTDRIFDVKVPGNVINQKEIKFIEFQTETKFKNLPVTDVEFKGKIKNISLKYPNILIQNLAKKIEFDVFTPDFKTYAFILKPLKYDDVFYMDRIKGKFNLKKGILSFNTNLKFKDNNLSFYVSNLNTLIEKRKNFFKNQDKFDLNLQILDKNASFKNVEISNILSFEKKPFVNFKLTFESLSFSKIINANNFLINIKAYDFNSTLFKKAINTKNKNSILKLFANGFKVDLNSSLKNLTFLGFNQGWFKLNIKAIFYKADNIKDFENHLNKYVAINIKADMSKEFAKMLRNSSPFIGAFVRVSPDKNGVVHVRINLPRGSIK